MEPEQVGGCRERSIGGTHTTRFLGLVDKPHLPLCQVLIPSKRDCDMTRKYMLGKCVRSHKSIEMDSQDLPQPCVGTFSTNPLPQWRLITKGLATTMLVSNLDNAEEQKLVDTFLDAALFPALVRTDGRKQ